MKINKRNYKAEYARRIARGLARGLTRSQARGHPKPEESFAYSRRLELGVHQMRSGASLSRASKSIGVAPERLKKYLDEAKVGKKQGRQWIIGTDRRKREMPIFSAGQIQEITLKNYKDSQPVGRYMEAVKKFLSTNDESVLKDFIGKSVVDVKGKRHIFETRPNVLYRLSASQKEPFEEVYRIVA
jgi:hypothetical protein